MNSRVKTVMTSDMITLHKDDSMIKAKEFFLRNEFHHLPVLDDDDNLMGMISKGDYYKLLDHFTVFNAQTSSIINNRFLKSLLAKEVMTSDLQTIHPLDTICKAAKIFMLNSFHALPVVKDNVLLGIITTSDIIQHFVCKEEKNNNRRQRTWFATYPPF